MYVELCPNSGHTIQRKGILLCTPVPISDQAINMHLETYLTRIKSYFSKKSSN